jgi:peptidyl-prolyl cis-trans isomerase D
LKRCARTEADLKKQQAQRKFAESAEAFTNGVYEQADSLKPTADRPEAGSPHGHRRDAQACPGARVCWPTQVHQCALRARRSVEKKRNTEAVEVGSNQLVSGRITSTPRAHAAAG